MGASDGDSGTTLAGAALGAASVGVISTAASLVPCQRTRQGQPCARLFAATGAALGLGAGATVGQQGADALDPIARGAAIGLLAGAVVGLGLRAALDRSTWLDVLALSVVGGAIGAAPVGSGIGFAAAGAVGLVLWRAVPDFTLPDAFGAGMIGMAVGSMIEWFDRARSGDFESVSLTVRLPLGAGW